MSEIEKKAEDIAPSIINQYPSAKDAYHLICSTYLQGYHDGENAEYIKHNRSLIR